MKKILFLVMVVLSANMAKAQYRVELTHSDADDTLANSGTSYFTGNFGDYSIGKLVTFQLNVHENSGTPSGDIIIEASTQTSDSQTEGWAEVKYLGALVTDTLVDGSKNYSLSMPLITNRMRAKMVRNGTMNITATGTAFVHK